MSIELKNVTYTYSPGTAYEIHALKDVIFLFRMDSLLELSGIQEAESLP